jgi:hypothetical protein
MDRFADIARRMRETFGKVPTQELVAKLSAVMRIERDAAPTMNRRDRRKALALVRHGGGQ